MKRTVAITLNGVTYPMCCSLGAIEEIEETFGSLSKVIDLMQAGSVKVSLDAFKIFLKYGAKRAKQYDEEVVEVPADLIDNLDLSDLAAITKKVVETIQVSQKNEIKAEAKKKEKETQ